jgi:hypothetical protein
VGQYPTGHAQTQQGTQGSSSLAVPSTLSACPSQVSCTPEVLVFWLAALRGVGRSLCTALRKTKLVQNYVLNNPKVQLFLIHTLHCYVGALFFLLPASHVAAAAAAVTVVRFTCAVASP